MIRRYQLLALLCALTAGGCGSDGAGLVSEKRGDRLERALEQAQSAVDRDECDEARFAAQKGALEAQNLPRSVDDELQRNLIDGFRHLEDRIREECGRVEQTPTPSPTAEETPTPTPTVEETPEPTPSPTATPTVAEPTPTPTPPNGGVQPEPTPGVDGQ